MHVAEETHSQKKGNDSIVIFSYDVGDGISLTDLLPSVYMLPQTEIHQIINTRSALLDLLVDFQS